MKKNVGVKQNLTEIVLWSGGFDSTLVLHQLLEHYPNDHITAVSVINKDVAGDRLKQEKKAKIKLLKRLGDRVDYKEINITSDLTAITWQMPIWLSHVLPYLKDGDHLSMGYLSSDGYSFFSARENFKKAFDATMVLQGKKDTELVFPLEGWTKGNVIRDLKKNRLLKDCWYCGKPKKGRPCGKCMKCVSVKRWGRYPETGEDV